MRETIIKDEIKNIYLSKVIFFLKRILTYLVFLLFPFWTHFIESPTFLILLLGYIPYSIFLFWQWSLLSKEVEHLLKIYTRSNSSMDRFLSRVLLGSSLAIFYCSFLLILSYSVREYVYWIVWISWGVWISWPTKKKILESKISSDFSEFRFLDGFEKTVLFFIICIFLCSIPSFPLFNGLDATKIYLDPKDMIHAQFWSFIELCYIPFQIPSKFKNLFIYFHFYFYFFTLGLIAIYAIFRYIYSRRLSILGLFAFISTWSFSILLENNIHFIFQSLVAIFWIWGILWGLKSYSYRAGFLLGFLNYWLILIDYHFILLIPVQKLLTVVFLRRIKSFWYIKQFLKYTIAGNLLGLFVILTHQNIDFFSSGLQTTLVLDNIINIFARKSFFTLALIGLLVLVLGNIFQNIYKEKIKREEALAILFSFLSLFIICFFINSEMIMGYFTLFIMVLISLVPLDILFERLNQLRSRRNLIFLVYILICLLDSHLEGRVKILWENFKNI